MNYNTIFKERLSKLLFLELDFPGFKKMVGIDEAIKIKTKDLYMPIDSEYVAKNAEDSYKVNNLPIYYFVEGMLYVLGADPTISYCDDYIVIINNIKESEEIGRSLVAQKVKKGNLVEGYLILKGLLKATGQEEYYKKLLFLGNGIREEDKAFNEIINEDIKEGMVSFLALPDSYLYKAFILKDEGDFKGAKVALNEYLTKGGEKNEEVNLLINNIENLSSYENAIEILDQQPEKAIALLLPLVEVFDKNPLLYYYLAVAYRKLENFEKGIYYLNESLSIESGILEVVNELGINYASLGEYELALSYFKKAFEAVKDVEICTNIIMCYMELNDRENAMLHLDIAKNLNEEDEIVIELERILKNKGA